MDITHQLIFIGSFLHDMNGTVHVKISNFQFRQYWMVHRWPGPLAVV